ncbi:hypothetical protein IE077_001945 [Cardiosporidium cionae]|uniref:Uncharacterized protein n=1 Tax=Cardiosporidium cionae TaxID=476202 RepID=A0ABQ7JBX0_9APIC|nr:hypothetical protein IE077_001945 [Cardiosporidium cionae]|eukprot:KAF8821511.1 hypothetical protein IE077_001945 [Cardiosporidium cionae]
MVKLRWKNAKCSVYALKLMEVAVVQVEERLNNASFRNCLSAGALLEPPHVPTLINDLLYEHCIAIAVSQNAEEGSCFRGLECAQFETMGKGNIFFSQTNDKLCNLLSSLSFIKFIRKVYNIAILMKPQKN